MPVRDFNVRPVRIAGRPGTLYAKVRSDGPALPGAAVVEVEIGRRWERARVVEPPPDADGGSLLWLELL